MKGVHIISGLSSTTISIWQVPDFPAPRNRPRSEKRTANTCPELCPQTDWIERKVFRILAFQVGDGIDPDVLQIAGNACTDAGDFL